MLTKSKIIEIITNNLPFLHSEYGVKNIGLFGSHAKNAQKEDSDIDIIAEFDNQIGLDFVEFAEYLEQLLGRKTNVITDAGIDGIRNKEIAKSIKDLLIYV